MKNFFLFSTIIIFLLFSIIGCIKKEEVIQKDRTEVEETITKTDEKQIKKLNIGNYTNPESSLVAEIANLIIEKLNK